jgi:chemotaxis protein histidine kinase CheA
VSEYSAEFVEIFLQEASERLQFLREYSTILLDTYPDAKELERLYIAAHALTGTAAWAAMYKRSSSLASG